MRDVHGVFEMIMAFFLLSLSLQVWAEDRAPSGVGGACQYETHPGIAEIVAITPSGIAEDPQDDEYTIEYVFRPLRPVDSPFFRGSRERLQLLLPDGSRPRRRFVERNRIVMGKKLDCDLRLIVQGACTPIIMAFPGLE
jgi:hypothetical protein